MDKPHFLVTAGSTREPIDAVRDWGNIFTGQTGLDIATALLQHGDVTLLTSNLQHAADDQHTRRDSHRLAIETFQRHDQLRSLLERHVAARPGAPAPFAAVFMTAAVSDYAPAGVFRIVDEAVVESANGPTGGRRRWLVEDVRRDKVSSSHDRIAVVGVPTEKLIDLFRPVWKYRGLLFKFKLEAGVSEEELVRVAQEARRHSQADYIIANTLEMARGESRAAYIISENEITRVSRDRLAETLADRAVQPRPAPGP